MEAPKRLSVVTHSPNYDRSWLARIDKVMVDGVHVPNCVAYDMVAGWAMCQVDRVWQPKTHGVVTVTLK